MKKAHILQAPNPFGPETAAEKLAKKFPQTFVHLRRDTTYMTADALWADMVLAGIKQDDLPAMEAAIQMPGFARIEQFKRYLK